MSGIFGDGGSTGNSVGYDLSSDPVFINTVASINNNIASSSVNLAPINASINNIELELVDVGLQLLTKVDKTVYDAKMAEIQTYHDSVDSTFNLIYDSIAPITTEQVTQNNRLTSLENNVASGYVTQADLYVVQTSQAVIDASQDAKIDDIYSRLGGTGQTVDLGPLTTRVTAIEAEQATQNSAINTKATTSYVDFEINRIQTDIDSRVPIDTYAGDLLNVTNRISAVESTSASNTSALNTKLNITSFNNFLVSQGGVDNTQNNRITSVENTLNNFSTTASRIIITQPESSLQSWLDSDSIVTAGQNIQIGTLEAKVSILEDAVINNPPTVAISQVTGLQTNLTSLQNQITTDVNALATHKTANNAHTAANISNLPITNLTQSQLTVQKALEAINSRVDLVTVNSTGFTSYGTSFLTNFYGAANALGIPSNMFAPNFVTNDETSTTITGNRGSVLWGINQNLARTSNVGFKTLRLGSKYPENGTAGDGSDVSNTSWDFGITNTINPGSVAANYYRVNPWRIELLNPYSSAAETTWSIRGPQFSGDTSSYMIVNEGMILTDTVGTFSKSFASIVSDIATNTSEISNLNTTVNSYGVSIFNLVNTTTNNTANINNLSTTVANLQNNMITSGSNVTFGNVICNGIVGTSSDGVITNGVYFDSQGRINQRTQIILDSTGNVYGHRLIGGVNNNNEESFRLLDYSGTKAFYANNTTFYSGAGNAVFDTSGNLNFNNELRANGVLLADSSRNIAAAHVSTTGLYVGGKNLIRPDGGFVNDSYFLDYTGTKTIIDRIGQIQSPRMDLVDTINPNALAFTITNYNAVTNSFMKYNGDCRFGDALQVFNNNGLLIRHDLSVQDPTFGAVIPIRRNCQILNIPALVDVNDVVLGYNNTIGGNWTSPFGSQRNAVICGAGNRTNGARSAIIGTNNVLENTLQSSFFVLGYGWSMNDIKRPVSLTEQAADYILLGNAQNENSANPLYMTIGGGMRMPTGSLGYPTYLVNSSFGTDFLPAAPSLTFARGVSARKYKKEIESIPTGTFKLDELNPVVYTLKDSGSREVGFIADDLIGTSWQPFVVQMNGSVEALNYANMVTGLVDIIKQQDQKQKDLERLLAKADQNQKDLELRVQNLENMIRELLKLE